MPRQFAPPAPMVAPVSGDMEQRLAGIAVAISKKADATTQPIYSGVGLIAPNGTVYMLTVDDSGTLTTAAVTPT
jgi:hypothetical protein